LIFPNIISLTTGEAEDIYIQNAKFYIGFTALRGKLSITHNAICDTKFIQEIL
jgi:hypothetical protein